MVPDEQTDVENTEDQEIDNTEVDENSESQEEEEEQSEPEKFRVVIDGKERLVTKDDLIKDYQIREASFERMKKAESLKEEVKPYLGVVRALKKGDLSVLRQLGLKKEDILNFSEKELKEYIEEQQLSPEAREAKEAKAEAEKLRAEKREFEAQQAAQRVENEIIEAFADAKIPLKGNHRLIRRVAEDMYGDNVAGYQTNAKKSLKKALQTIEQEFHEHIVRSLQGNAEKFLDSLPAELVDGVRKKGLKQVRSQSPLSKVSDTSAQKQKKKSLVSDDFRKYMREELRKRG